MAEFMSIDELRNLLSTHELIEADPFEILHRISCYVNNPDDEDTGRELVLRALEKRDYFQEFVEILDSLTRQVGLFPYLEPDQLSFRDLIAHEFHRPPSMEETFVFHRAQAEIYRRLVDGENVILSAPTSFGKSRIIDAIIAKEGHANIAVVVPTIALIDETRRRFSVFSDRYKIVTQITQKPSDRNLFVFTAERINAYEDLPAIEFFAIDEFYKIGSMSEDETRTIALNQAFYKLYKGGGQFYLLGPNIRQIPEGLEDKFHCFFYSTNFATVVSEMIPVYETKDEVKQLVDLAKNIEGQTLIFCRSPKRVNDVTRALVENKVNCHQASLESASEWISANFHPEWIFQEALTAGIGMHHGRLPRSLAQYSVRCFNESRLKFLVCTSTLIEGVNTKAKNVIIFDNVIGSKKYDYFTFNNIRGRSGRMFQHFIGKVYIFHQPPQQELPFVDFPVYSQDDTIPESLLIQLDEEDLTTPSRGRIADIYEQEKLPLRILRQNSGIDPRDQIALAEYLETLSFSEAELLNWNQLPNWDQLSFACELIWKYLTKRRARSGVFSAPQLAFKTNVLMHTPDVRARIEAELQPGEYAAKTPDEAVERVFEFDRNWAGFEFPRLLMALSKIQEFVFQKKYSIAGDYSYFASKVETLNRSSVSLALEEYGLPLQITDKIGAIAKLSDDLDEALSLVKQLPITKLNLSTFEEELFKDVQAHL